MNCTSFTPPRARRLALSVAVVAIAAPVLVLAADPASAADLALRPQAPTDWLDARTATVAASVVGLPEGTPVAIAVARGAARGCSPDPGRARSVVALSQTARTFDPVAPSATSQPSAELIATVSAPRPGRVGTVCAWARLADGSILRDHARLRTPRHLRVGSTTAAAPFDPLWLARRLHLGQILLGVMALVFLVRLPFRVPAMIDAAITRVARETRRGLHRARSTHGPLSTDAATLEDLAQRSAIGDEAEQLVRDELTAVEDRGGVVYYHVFPPGGGGDVDHVVRTPDGRLWAIETKAGSHVTRAALQQAARNAHRVAAVAGVAPEVCQAVLCLARRTAREAVTYDVDATTVIVTGPSNLVPLLLGGASQQQQPACDGRRRSRWTAAQAA